MLDSTSSYKCSSEIESIRNLLYESSTTKDFSNVMVKLFLLFKKMNSKELESFCNYSKYNIDLITEVFKNKTFNNSLYLILHDKSLNRGAGKIVNICLKLSAISIANTVEFIGAEQAENINRVFFLTLSNLPVYLRVTNKPRIESICKILLDQLFGRDKYEKIIPPEGINTDEFLPNIKLSNAIIASMLGIMASFGALKDAFKSFLIEKNKDIGDKNFHLTKNLDHIYSRTKSAIKLRDIISPNKVIFFDKFINNFDCRKNEIIATNIISKMTKNFHFQKESTFIKVVFKKAKCTQEVINEINIIKNSFSAFSKSKVESSDEWSNKIYLISLKTLSAINAIYGASDKEWALSAILYEYYHWIDNVHEVINRYDIEDDWSSIDKFTNQENGTTEWKSTFFTSTEEPLLPTKGEEKAIEKKIFGLVIKNIIAMMNSKGGVILVGLVENPKAIVRKEVIDNLVYKEGFTFFNVNYELNKKNFKLDDIKMMILDALFNKTQLTADKFNDLWSIERLEIKDKRGVANIYKIVVSRSEKYIYHTKKEGGKIWISLIKRADGRVVEVDPREHLNGNRG